MTRLFSPYQLNPFNIHPLRSILSDTVDFDAIRSAQCPIKLFLSATNVRTGKIRVFENDEIGPDAYLSLQEQLDWSELTSLADDRKIEEI